MAKSYHFFGALDRRNHNMEGEILSEYPVHMMPRHIEELENQIVALKGMINRSEVPSEDVQYKKQELQDMELKLDGINKSKHTFTLEEKKEVLEELENIESQIEDSLFTRSQMEMGTVDPHIEAERDMNPCIKVKNPYLIKALNLKATGNFGGSKVSRNEAIRGVRIMANMLGRDFNIEELRKDKKTTRGSKYVTVTADGATAASTKT